MGELKEGEKNYPAEVKFREFKELSADRRALIEGKTPKKKDFYYPATQEHIDENNAIQNKIKKILKGRDLEIFISTIEWMDKLGHTIDYSNTEVKKRSKELIEILKRNGMHIVAHTGKKTSHNGWRRLKKTLFYKGKEVA
jgi:hypothetical protein